MPQTAGLLHLVRGARYGSHHPRGDDRSRAGSISDSTLQATLIVKEIVDFAPTTESCQGQRGSAANSVVCAWNHSGGRGLFHEAIFADTLEGRQDIVDQAAEVISTSTTRW